MRRPLIGYALALGSAVFIGLFTVLNKWLLVGSVSALTVGARTYAAASVALLPRAIRAGEFRFARPWALAGWLLAGSVVGPSLDFVGHERTSGVQGVPMIHCEAVFTAFLSFLFFKERLAAWTVASRSWSGREPGWRRGAWPERRPDVRDDGC